MSRETAFETAYETASQEIMGGIGHVDLCTEWANKPMQRRAESVLASSILKLGK